MNTRGSQPLRTVPPFSGAEPALRLRPYRGPEDHPAMTRVVGAVRLDNGDAEPGTVADMDNHYAHLNYADLPRDCALVELDGVVVGYGRASWEETIAGDFEVQAVINTEPANRGRGVEELLVRHVLLRAEELIATLGADRPTRVLVYAVDRDAGQRAALEAVGFRTLRQDAQLVRPTLDDIPDIPLPEGFEIRRIDAADAAMHRRVFDAAGRAFAESHGEVVQGETQFQRFLNQPGFDPPLWRIAFHGDDIAGQILNFMAEPEPDGTRTGWTESISVQPEFRRRGLARALLAESLRAVRDAGATRAVLGVDMQNENQARLLYESVGYRIVSITHEYGLGPFAPGSRPQLVPESWR